MQGGKQPTGPDGHWLEPLTLLSVLAGITSHTRLMTGILLAGLRTPATLAKTAATLDVLSEGRLDLGVGVGWQREEYEANGIPHARRGDRLDHTLAICQLLWREEVAAPQSPDGNCEQCPSFENVEAQLLLLLPYMPQPGERQVFSYDY